MDPIKALPGVLKESLADVGIVLNAEGLRHLAASRDIEIYLDGFDEVDQKIASKIDRELAYMAKNHPLIKIFISARPHVGLAQNSELTAFRIEKLDKSDAKRLINKISIDAGLAAGLNAKLDAHKAGAVGLLETPLLVTLLVAQYSQTYQIPERLSDFYENIFQTLFDKHDSYKVPFQRIRRLKLTTQNYKSAFQRFCYASLFATRLDDDMAGRISAWAIRPAVVSESRDFLNDVREISALIVEDSGLWSFIHNSLQEYYAAAYLMSQSDELLEADSKKVQELANASTKLQVLGFAKEISDFRSAKFVELPFLDFRASPIGGDNFSSDELVSWLIQHVVEVKFDMNLTPGGRFFSVWLDVQKGQPVRCFSSEDMLTKVTKILESDSTNAEKLAALLLLPVISNGIIEGSKRKLLEIVRECRDCRENVAGHSIARSADSEFLTAILGG